MTRIHLAPPPSSAATQPEVDRGRRTALRGALAAGCGLLLAACGKQTPATGTPTPAAAPAAPPSPTESAAPATSPKVSQASVQYQRQPKGDQKCADCMHFIAASNSCKLVEGSISPTGWCLLWARKA